MKLRYLPMILVAVAIATGQSASKAIVTNLDTAKWAHESGDAPGSEGVTLHEDAATGGMDLLVRYPAGHVIPAHFHDSNERIFVAEGQLILRQENGDNPIKTGGFAFLPAREVQRLSCGTLSGCTFYISWDGKPNSHAVK
jgi:quercetin dioxygenase-like cupin family protein